MRKQPFTLVEMVVAMGIFVMAAAIIGTASSIFYNAYERSVKSTNQMKEYMAIDQLMDQSVRNLIPFTWENTEDDQPKSIFEGKTDSMIFAALRRTHSRDNGALIFIRIRVLEENLVAEYSPYPLLPWQLEEDDDETLYEREILARNVQQIQFLYAERDSEGNVEFLDEWIEDDHFSTPLAVQMEVQWNNGKTERWLRRTAGSAANTAYGNRQDQTTVQAEGGRGGVR